MYPTIEIGSFSINSSLLMWGIGIVLCEIYYVVIGKKFGYRWYKALMLGIIILLFEIFGAKILYILENIGSLDETVFSWSSGYSLFGVFLFTPIFLWLAALIIGEETLKLYDFASVGIMIELSLYRIGCMLGGCCYGIETTIGIYMHGATRFPVQPLEACLDMLIAVVVLVLNLKGKLYRGEQYFLTIALYGLVRFVLEFFRVRTNIVLNLSLSHFLTLFVMTAGIVFMIYSRLSKRPKALHKTLTSNLLQEGQ